MYCKQVYFTWEKCIECALTLHRKSVETQVFYPLKSQGSCPVQHLPCTQNVIMNSLFNILECQAAFSTRHCSEAIKIYMVTYNRKWDRAGPRPNGNQLQTLLEWAFKHKGFIRRYRGVPAKCSTVPAPNM